MPHSNIDLETRRRAKALRRKMTSGEAIMWRLLLPYRQAGRKFRRETPIGPYIADFAWLSGRIVIEVDGDLHGLPERIAADMAKDRFLVSQGFRVLRFNANDLAEDSDGAGERLAIELGGI